MLMMSALVMAAALATGEPGDQDGVVATAPATAVDLSVTAQPTAPSAEGSGQAAVPHNLTTDEQIDRWIAARDPEAKPYADTGYGLDMRDDRKMHSQVDVGFGTGGYRDYGMAVSMPLGENGRLNLSFRQVENGYPYGYGGYGYGGYGLGRSYFDDSGYVFPGRSRPDAAYEFESRLMRPGGPPQRRPLLQPRLTTED